MIKGSALAFLVGVAVAGAADDAKAPLAETSRQLDQLQKQPASAAAGGEDGSLHSALPSLGSTLQGREALPTTDPASGLKDRKTKTPKKDPNRNWLVDGYEKLDPKANHDKDAVLLPAPATSNGDNPDGRTEEAPTTIDIFSLYQADAKDHGGANQPADHVRTTADPLAPFLQTWLAKSPDRELLLPDTPKSDFSSNGAPAIGGTQGASSGAGLSVIGPELGRGSTDGTPNPYLTNLTLPSLDSLTSTAVPAMMPAIPDPGPLVAPTKPNPVLTPDILLPPARLDGHKPPPSPADEDRKYFPQLNRF